MSIEEGQRVRLAREIERYPHYVAPAGAEGTVTKNDKDLIAVRLDDQLEGAEEWDNEVQWYEGMYVNDNFRDVFQQDVEVLE